MHAANQLLLVALAVILAVATLATAAPVSENPPNDPLVVFYWVKQPYGPTTVQVTGDYQTAAGQCRGLEGREDGFLLLQTQPPYSDWTPAWNVKLYRDWGCTGEPVAELNSYHSLQGLAYPDPADPKKPLVVKSLAFVPAAKTQP
ncbi:hypothetical protein AMAG_08785 [Allomyces macrogynus ATCC 38327]|uniref:Uncharacterized protein n=1 Tax=Allomyces macrogynus (strain ATCC 38327) TaxID=578462 RepID=A0A0L0SMT4_ALLM3|nr:hypothetical protein AMAG_08785 [Allomyces macrogynus ATCC 38327]|eukprot:KNE63689.1 hypothetical protein AMAG_08785 [Allomyces macrogynus ATCC 38327]